MTPRLRFLAIAPLLALAALGGAGCTTNPATGQSSFTAFMSPDEEIRVGREQHPQIIKEFGGEYQDPAVRRYVAQLGERLARSSELPDLQFTFTVLNSDIVNAFALPGGYVYVTRGLLALASSEAELAGVLGHEIGHVTARHTAQRYSAAVAANIAVGLLGAVAGSDLASSLGQSLAEVALAGYSREQESQADLLGVRYLGRTSYDQEAMATFLAKLQGDSALTAELAGRPGTADQFDIMQSHPRTADRVRDAIAAAHAQAAPPANPREGRDDYLKAIDGLYWGGDPESGFVHNRSFIHPALRFQFEAPPGFRLFNADRAVTARGPNKAQIVFSRDMGAGVAAAANMVGYLQGAWAREIQLGAVEAINVNGLDGATGATRLNTRSGPIDVRLVAVRFDPRTVYRFVFVTLPEHTAELSTAFRRVTYSFRALSAREAATLKPLRIRVVQAGPGDTVDSLARRMAIDDLAVRRFQVLNGLAPGQALRPGDRVKIIAD